MSDFQFSFNPIYKKFVRELRDDENAEVLTDHAYMYVKKENLKRSDEQQKLTVMSYLNQQKIKLEKQEENNNIAMGDDYIREVDEYSEETHSDDMYGNRKRTEKQTTSKSRDTIDDPKKNDYSNINTVEQMRNVQKRINQLLNQKFIPGSETAEKLIEKIQEITEIVS